MAPSSARPLEKGEEMRKKHRMIVAGVVAAAFAGPGAGVAAADFVCPVLGANGTKGAEGLAKAAANGNTNLAQIGGGDWSVIGPDVGGGSVPDQATNTLPDGSPGTPGGDHASPGDRGYTAIWNTD
jgi:hypothetical protein